MGLGALTLASLSQGLLTRRAFPHGARWDITLLDGADGEDGVFLARGKGVRS